MASIIKRKGGKCWYARFRDKNGKLCTVSTKMPVNPKPTDKLTPKQAEKLAREVAEQKERDARGQTKAAADSLRAMAQAMEDAAGGAPAVSIRGFLEGVYVGGQAKAQDDNRRTFKEFIAWLGGSADESLSALNWKTCLAFLGHLIGQGLALSTVGNKRGHLSTAWRKAVRDDIASKNPWEFATMDEVRRRYAPEQKAGKNSDREPFTDEEMKIILTQFPQMWQDAAAVSFYLGGLRLGDSCGIKWEALDLERCVVTMRAKKTNTPIMNPIPQALMPRLRRLRDAAPADAVYVFPKLAADIGANGSTSKLSNSFMGLLRAFGIVSAAPKAKKGRGRNMSNKTFHSFRHTASTTFAAAGVPEAVAMAIVAHADREVHAVYVKIGLEAKRNAMTFLPDFGA